MSDLQVRFEQAANHVHALSQRADNATLPHPYAAGVSDSVQAARSQALATLRGVRRDEAMQHSIRLVTTLTA